MNCMCSKKRRPKDGDIYLPRPNPVAPRLPSKKKVLPGVTRSDPPQHERLGLCELAPEVPLRVNDRVVWVSDHGPEYGTVRWLGHLHDTSQDLMVGVEFDNRVGTGTGKYRDRQLFEAQLGHASLIPLLGLLRADDYLGEQTQANWGGSFPGQVDYGNSSFYLSRHEGRPRVDLSPNLLLDQHNPLSGDGQSNHTTNLQRPHDPQRNTGNGSQQKKSSVAVRHNDRINASVDTRQKKCELKEGSGAALPLGHPGGTSRDVSDLQGREKGIQGHHNSCYLDATLFAMFSCTNVFDGMLNRPKKETPKERDIDAYSDIQAVLRDDIVNTLRRHKFVPHKNVMKLRELLDALGGVSGLTTEEKDPEEFLNSLFMALRVDPYLQLSSGQGTHLYQLFVEKHQLLDIPTVQQLFHHSIHDSNIKLKQIPPVLIIQMPRFGKQFKVYPCIIPSLKLDITDALENSPRSCFVCGRLACKECRDCFRPDVGLEGTSYCSPCSDAVHKHPDRQRHPLSNLKVNETIDKEQPVQRHYMDLCAVVCIETSHYVCFVKYGESDQSTWVFFDSMADREGGEDGHNIPEVVEFHDHKKWLSDAAMTELKEYPDKKLVPNMGRRLLCDAYMCMYKSNMASRYC